MSSMSEPENTSGIDAGNERVLGRKAYIVRLIQPIPQLGGFDRLLSDYWDAVKNQIERQETSVGPVRRIFAESVVGRGEDALVMLQQINPGAHRLARRFVDYGAVFEELEDAETLQEVIDWSQCVNAGVASQKVRGIVENGYRESTAARSAHMAKKLDEAIGNTEAALILAMSDSLPIPAGIDRYIVSPPELDRLERWLREKVEEAQRQMAAQAQAQQAQATDGPSTADSGGGLWTPP